MLPETIILQSAGSLSVAVMALLMLILQTLFFFRKPQFTWYAWSAAIAFSALLYSVGIFIEYNTTAGPLNRFSGLLEYTAIICLAHCLYGFTFSYLGIESRWYHPVAGVCHGLILILLWSTNYIVSESFTTRDFIGLGSPYIEPDLGPLGPVFVLYAATVGVIAMTFWIKHKRTDPKHRIIFLTGMGFWLLLGIHDGLASLGLPTFQYFMEYGFLGFAMVVLWVVFNSYLEIAAEDKYRVITEFANDGIMVIQDGKMVFRNPAGCDLIGVPLTDSEPGDFLDIMMSEDRKTVLKHYHTLLEGGNAPNPHTVRIRGADGEQKFVEIASSLIQYRNRPAVLAIMRDMTKRKRAEEVIRESEERFRLLSEASFEGILIHDKGEILDANQTFAKIFGYELDEIIGMNVLELAAPECREVVKRNVLSGLEEAYEAIGLRKDGSTFPGELRGRQTKYKGKTVRITAARDLSEQKKAEEALRESEENYRSMMEAMDDAIYICSSDFRIEYMNPAMINRIGRDATGEPCHKVMHGLDEKCPWCIHEKIMRGRYIKTEVVSPADHKTYHISNSPMFHTDKSVSKLTVFRDITEMKKLQAHLQRAQKMEAIGTLAGGIAHDFNNILMAILANCDLAKMKLAEDSEAIDNLNQVKHGGYRARRLIQQILTFSRMGEQERIALSLTPLIKEALKFLKSTLPASIEIRDYIEADPGIIEADATQIHQIVMNLCTNAEHAMREEGGTLDVKLTRVEVDRQTALQHHELHTGPHVRLIVTDTGCGMDSETLEHIFDPYFTTKEVGEGTGLGLSVVHGIVNTHNGVITVESEPGKGTTFNVYFPITEKDEKIQEESDEPLPTGNERILFVDDEQVIVYIAEEMLKELGYNVVTKKSSVEALELFRADPGRFDLVITDMTMPKMTGDKLARELMKIRPDIPVILCTGFSPKISEEKAKEIGIKAFAMKPLVGRDMANTVRKALGN